MSIDVILEELEKIHEKLDRLLASRIDFDSPERITEIEAMDRMIERDTKKGPLRRVHSPGFKDYELPEIAMTEEIIMDLKDVQCIATTEKAILVTKKGYQKWIPISQISENTKAIEEGDFLEDIELNEKAKNWIPDKPWDKFEVFKG